MSMAMQPCGSDVWARSAPGYALNLGIFLPQIFSLPQPYRRLIRLVAPRTDDVENGLPAHEAK
jgi:hypothetical protein